MTSARAFRLTHHSETAWPDAVPVPERILATVAARTFREASGCHFYNVHLGNRLKDYPRAEWHVKGREYRIALNRLALMIRLDRPIAPGMFALHRCNDPRCINGAHLYEGTLKENTADRIRFEAGRRAAGLPLRFVRPRPALSSLECDGPIVIPLARRAA